jgi:hypothetical protein
MSQEPLTEYEKHSLIMLSLIAQGIAMIAARPDAPDDRYRKAALDFQESVAELSKMATSFLGE